MHPKVKKYLKRGVRVLLLLLVLLISFGYLVFKSSSVQTYITNQIGSSLSKKTNTIITVQEVDFKPFSTVVLKGLLILDHHKDTLLYSGSFSVDLTEYDLDKKNINLAFLELNEAYVNIIHYEDEEKNNLIQFLEKMSGEKKATNDSVQWNFLVENLVFDNLNFTYWNYNKLMKYKGIDYDHVVISNGAASVDHVIFVDGAFMADFEHLSFEEKSGFVLTGYKGGFKMSNTTMFFDEIDLVTPDTKLTGDLKFKYKKLQDLSKFLTKVKIESELENCDVAMSDIAYFAPELEGIKEKFKVSGNVVGTISDLKAKKCYIRYGDKTHFKGNVEISGIPDMKNAFIYVDVKELKTNNADIEKIPIHPFTEGKTVHTPYWFGNFGDIVFNGSFTGFLSDFVAYGKFKSDCGIVNADVELLKDSLGDAVLVGNVKTKDFSLKTLSKTDALGNVSAKGKINARFNREDFLVDFKGEVPLFDLLDYRYEGIKMDGRVDKKKFSGEFDIKDTNLVMNFAGDINFSTTQQQYKFKTNIEKANIHNINWVNRDSSTTIHGKIDMDITGKQIEDVNGTIDLKDFVWEEKGQVYNLNRFQVNSLLKDGKELMKVESDLLVGRIEGKYDLKEIYPSIINILSRDMPSIIDWKYSPKKFSGKNNFKVMFKLKDYKPIHELFTPQVDFAANTKFSGTFNDIKQEFYMNFSSDTFKVADKEFKNIKLFTHNKEEQLYLRAKIGFAQLFDTVGLEKFKITTSLKNNKCEFDVGWDNNYSFTSSASLQGVFGFEKLDSLFMHIKGGEILYRNGKWKMHDANSLVIHKNKFIASNFSLISDVQSVSINGTLGEHYIDKLLVDLKGFELNNLQYFFDKASLDLSGEANGELTIRSGLNKPLINSDLSVDRMRLNGQPFGKVRLSSTYLSKDQRIEIDLSADHLRSFNQAKAVTIKGDYYPTRDEDQLDLRAKFSVMRLGLLEKYFEGLFSDFKRGKVTGELDIKGNLNRPKMFGDLTLSQMNIMMDYLNVRYAIDGQKITFDEETIKFKNFELSHNMYAKSKAVLNGYVSHEGFKNIKYNFAKVKLSNMLALNTSEKENPTYYGKAFVNGTIYLRGDGKDNYIGGNISTTEYKDTKESTELTLPLMETGEIELSDFIHFVKLNDTNSVAKTVKKEVDVSGLNLDFDFDINPTALVKIVFDPTVGDEIKVKGNGQINLQINSEGKFLMNGDYTVSDGSYYFTLRSLIGRKFIVKPGSKISWNGDPANANLDIKTYYNVYASLNQLVDTTGSNNMDEYNRFSNNQNVHASFFLNGSLWKPEIGMGVSLPNAVPEEIDFLESKLITEEQISQQVFSLLLTGRFLRENGGVSLGAINNGTQIVEGQVNNLLSNFSNKLVKGVDLGVDYNQGSQADSVGQGDELRLLVGYQYKKFKIKTNYDLNNSVGDIQAEYKITDNTKLKAYNKTEDDRLNSANGQATKSNTTGVGIMYQKSFNSFKDLFYRQSAKEEEPPAIQNPG